MNHRRTPAAGIRPPRHPVRIRRRCVVCRRRFTIDRRRTPWSRRRTCWDESCRARLGNRGRNSSNCSHCGLVESYRLARDSDMRENIEIAGGDERPPLDFRTFLTGWRAEREPEGMAA